MPKTFPTPKLVIFDCDGVLVDSEPASNQALADNLSRHGLPLTVEQSMAHFVGGTMTGVMQTARSLGANLPDNWIEEIYGETYALLRQGVPLVQGIPDLLARLDADATRLGAQLVTTEKDSVRLPKDYRMRVLTLPVRLEISDWAPIDALLDRILSK